jgi:hypothetical protein
LTEQRFAFSKPIGYFGKLDLLINLDVSVLLFMTNSSLPKVCITEAGGGMGSAVVCELFAVGYRLPGIDHHADRLK